MKRSVFLLIVLVLAGVFLTNSVLAQRHCVILSPLDIKNLKDVNDIDLKKNVAYVDLTTSAQVDFDIVIYPDWTFPSAITDIPQNEDLFGSSLSVEPNLFSYTGTEPALVCMNAEGAYSYASLYILSDKESIMVLVPPVTDVLGTGFQFSIGDPGIKTTLYIANAAGGPTATVYVIYGTDIEFLAAQVPSLSTATIPIEAAYSSIKFYSDVEILAMLEIVYDKNNTTRTILIPN